MADKVYVVLVHEIEDTWVERAFSVESEAEQWVAEYNAMDGPGSARAWVKEVAVGRRGPNDAPYWVGTWSSSGAYGQARHVSDPLNLDKPQQHRIIGQAWWQEVAAPPRAEIARLEDGVYSPRVEVHGTDREAVERLLDETVKSLKDGWGGGRSRWWAHLVMAYAQRYHPNHPQAVGVAGTNQGPTE